MGVGERERRPDGLAGGDQHLGAEDHGSVIRSLGVERRSLELGGEDHDRLHGRQRPSRVAGKDGLDISPASHPGTP